MMVSVFFYSNFSCTSAVADPGFPRGAPTLVGANLLFGIIFAENCMKMKKIGPRGDVRPSCCLDPSMFSGESRRRHSWVGEGQDVGGWEKQILYFASPP